MKNNSLDKKQILNMNSSNQKSWPSTILSKFLLSKFLLCKIALPKLKLSFMLISSMLLSLSTVFAAGSPLLFPIDVHAQVTNNVRNLPSNAQGNGYGLVNKANPYLTEKAIQLNATGSCDSTCDAMGPTAPASSMQGAFITRVVACSTGYTGSRAQTRTQNPDGTYTAWVDTNTSQCVCSPTYFDDTQMCASPLSGTYIQRTPWNCSSNVGTLGAPSVVANNCFVPCAPANPSTETKIESCPSGYTGSVSSRRDSSCPSGIGTNSSPSWSGWYTTSDTCVMENSCPYPYTWCSGPMGRNTGSYPQGTGRCYSWGFSYSSGSGTWCKAMGT